MADALDSKSGFSDEVWVQVPSPVPIEKIEEAPHIRGAFFVGDAFFIDVTENNALCWEMKYGSC